MEVILRETIENLGRRGEIVKVADGYARNYLLPRKLALPATEGNKKHVERERKIMESREAEEKGISLADHATHLIIHGTLHLVGYDHMDDAAAAAMEALEVKALASLGIANPYADQD